jgi:membrane-bound lytic murein transglycosylase B
MRTPSIVLSAVLLGPVDNPLEQPQKKNNQTDRDERSQKKNRAAHGRGRAIRQQNNQHAQSADQPQAVPNEPVFGLCGVFAKIDR